MSWMIIVAQWLHVLLGIFWFGSTLYTDFILIPAVGAMPPAMQREIGMRVGTLSARIIEPVATLVILLGVLRGTVFGSIQSFDALGTTYGATWLVALLAAIGVFLWGKFVLSHNVERLNAVGAKLSDEDIKTSPAYASAFARVRSSAMLELLGFVVVFTCMTLMHFDL